MALNLKAYLDFDTENQEIRRFSIQDSNWENLKQKLKDLFPRLGEVDFTVYWTDPEEELVIISSSEELVVAVENSGDDALKIYIRTRKVKKDESKEEPGMSAVFVTCDGCDKKVSGPGFRCTTCPDFDLCMACEAQGIHGEHDMIRIHIPDSFCHIGPKRGRPCRGHGGGRRGCGMRGFGGRGRFGRGRGFGPFGGPRGFGFEVPPPPPQFPHPPHGPQHPPPFHPLFNAWFSIGASPFEDSVFNSSNRDYCESGTDAATKESRNVNEEGAVAEELSEEIELARCISQMEAMGFRDDGGWLKALIQEKNYNIDKVLEALHPEKSEVGDITKHIVDNQ